MKEKKQYTAFYIERSVRLRIQKIVENPNTTFDDMSSFVRYACKKTLAETEEELKKNEST